MTDNSKLIAALRLKRPDAPIGKQHYSLDEVVEIMAQAADEIERLSARLEAAEAERNTQSAQLKRAREALGFGVEHEEVSDGITVTMTEDAVIDLMGALDDLTNSNGNDEVTRSTIARVIARLETVRAVLSDLQRMEGGT